MGSLLPGIGVLEDILTIIGLLYAGKLILCGGWSIIIGVRAHLWSRLFKKKFAETYGKWAVITGSTDGIGKEYARQLAESGMNVILISRTMEKLEKVAKEIREEFGVAADICQTDFSDGRQVYDNIAQHLEGKEIGILVNNVGVMLPYPMKFESVTDRDIWMHVNVNVASVPAMTKLVLPGMVARGKGAIINIASIAAAYPIPLMGIYSATKAFVDYFSQSLEFECRGTGIVVQTITPSYVSTNMTSFSEYTSRPSLVIPTAERFVRSALKTLGYARRSSGFWTHGIQLYFVENFLTKWMFMYGNFLWNAFLSRNLKKEEESR